MRFRCPTCDQRLELPDDLAGPSGTCPRCGEPVQLPARRPVREAVSAGADRLSSRRAVDDDEDERRLDVSRPPPARWGRFVSPSLLTLALLTLPLPWVEVRCNRPGNQPTFHYSQTGLQMMADQQTDLAEPPAAAAGAPARGEPPPRPARQVTAILLAVTLVAGAVLGVISGLACRIAHLCCAAFAFLLVPVLVAVTSAGEAFNSVTYTPWPLVAFLLCAAGLVMSIIVLARHGASVERPSRREWDEDG